MVETGPRSVTDYVLYGVGALVGGEPFAHYERASAIEIPLYSNYLDFDVADDAFDAAVGELQERRPRSRRPATGPAARRGSAARWPDRYARWTSARRCLIRQQERTAEYYEDWERRRMLAGKLQLLEDVANEPGPAHVRPVAARGPARAARPPADVPAPRGEAVVLEIAREYARVFDRPLPVTSLVRSYRYQSVLRRTNRNATSIDAPPHSTGLAFDLLTRFMTAAEQEYLMAIVARLEDEGRVEALREGNRDHLHVFAFADGVRPPAAAIARSLELVARQPPPAPRSARGARPRPHRRTTMSFAPSAPRLPGPALPR